jgi:hypothetical protein
LRLVISQPEAVSDIAMPVSATVLAIHIAAKAGWLKAPHRPGAGSIGVEEGFGSPLKPISRTFAR